ncbi:hypothetical protein Mycch_0768 [Mycolicibacterium chubuense NBB4]|uniref:Uncharacterized protein n=1 Tax=Mycolicibacterium chubuense (strain NBB4) TaxID=710421 RepID=I4BE78_MYCCN|nr:DUF5994 family protein [Mycolicibacterium chubuense]AFM15585.1 hypothetical protein Mycch_0768 [Mycolicibacterium chubuense NBB4]
MNGIPRGRRASTPIRVMLADQLGNAIDGGWWPHTSAMAAELPELISALHEPLGEIDAIRINWSPLEGQLDLETIVQGARLSLPGGQHRRPRLMVVVGRRAQAKLLVVPSLTSRALGSTVLRTVAGLGPAEVSGDGRILETACAVLRLAESESATWCASLDL